MILQDPMASLNPLFPILYQVGEPAYFHRGLRRHAWHERVISLLQMVRIPSPAARLHDYPHQLSGGIIYAGKIVEQGPVREIYNTPRHPYTEGLLKSIPKLGSKAPLFTIPGQPPDVANLPPGCAFHPRCPSVMERCHTEKPVEFVIAPHHSSRCWRAAPEATQHG